MLHFVQHDIAFLRFNQCKKTSLTEYYLQVYGGQLKSLAAMSPRNMRPSNEMRSAFTRARSRAPASVASSATTVSTWPPVVRATPEPCVEPPNSGSVKENPPLVARGV